MSTRDIAAPAAAAEVGRADADRAVPSSRASTAAKELAGRTALVTGASSGIGEALARALAERGASVVLLARREERLRALAGELEQRYGVETQVLARDLTAPGMAEQVFEALRGRPVDVLVNNAGYGLHGSFLDLTWERQRHMVELDVICLLQLTRLFVPPMVERGFGHVLQVASTAAFQPTPTFAVYAASKSFVLSFGEALAHELKGTGVSCTVACPGFTQTEFAEVAGHVPGPMARSTRMGAEQVAQIAVKAMLRGRPSLVTGWKNALTAWTTRLVPRRAATAIAAKFVE
jgi:hypothetical protein